MTTLMRRLSVVLVFAAMLLGLVLPAKPVFASVKGRRNTALALSGAALYHLVKGHGPEALLFAGGAVYAWQRVRDAKHHTHYRLHRVGTVRTHHVTHHHRYARR